MEIAVRFTLAGLWNPLCVAPGADCGSPAQTCSHIPGEKAGARAHKLLRQRAHGRGLTACRRGEPSCAALRARRAGAAAPSQIRS